MAKGVVLIVSTATSAIAAALASFIIVWVSQYMPFSNVPAKRWTGANGSLAFFAYSVSVGNLIRLFNIVGFHEEGNRARSRRLPGGAEGIQTAMLLAMPLGNRRHSGTGRRTPLAAVRHLVQGRGPTQWGRISSRNFLAGLLSARPVIR